jgi:hypothetical protein
MIRSQVVALFLYIICSTTCTWGQTDINKQSKSNLRLQGFYASIIHTNISGFPLTYKTGFMNEPLESAINSSASGLAYAGGVSVVDDNGLYGGLEFEFSKFSFTDDRLSNRNIFFYYGFLDLGLMLSRQFPIASYISIGFGGFHQSDYPEWLEEGYDLEYLDENDGHGILGLGIKLSPIARFILKCELKFTLVEHTYIPSDERDWYFEFEEKHEWEMIGRRVSVGLTYIFGGQSKRF